MQKIQNHTLFLYGKLRNDTDPMIVEDFQPQQGGYAGKQEPHIIAPLGGLTGWRLGTGPAGATSQEWLKLNKVYGFKYRKDKNLSRSLECRQKFRLNFFPGRTVY